jgi:two-component system NtrC family response regulator
MNRENKTLLIVEDDPGVQRQMKWGFDAYETIVAKDRESALAQVRRHEPAVITLDLGLPPHPDGASEGLAALEQILALSPDSKVIVVTGNHDRANALKAVAMGAYDFYQKPFDLEILRLAIERAFRLYALQAENRQLQQTLEFPLAGVITRDARMLKICRSVEKVAASDATVMLAGESGTGKELLARALHQLSPRSSRRFLAINCAAIPETLLESELFGYERGAFTGAARQTRGKIEFADGGTFFLDEVGDLPLALQAKLVRFLQERVLERIGGREEIAVDVRIVCATHQDLKKLMQEGKFRDDLYYRLSEIVIEIPPLRERPGDATLLAHAFMQQFCGQQGRSRMRFAPDALDAIERYSWPGNVRELENVVKRAVIMAESAQIGAADMGLAPPTGQPEPMNLRQVREQAERDLLVRVLSRVDGNIASAADLLGVSRPTLYDLLNRHGLRPTGVGRPDDAPLDREHGT